MATQQQWVYLFSEADATNRTLLGGKGAGLAAMTQAGLPVPPGFTITTEACRAYYQHNRTFPEGMWSQTQRALSAVEAQLNRRFGDTDTPLLVSVRSGAPLSMPGMMDTVLNLGLNDETVEGLARMTNNRRFALDAYRRFISMFGSIVLGIDKEKFSNILNRFLLQTPNSDEAELSIPQLEDLIAAYQNLIFAELHGKTLPQDPYEQLRMAIAAVFDSWMGKRAVHYRRTYRIPDSLGTAVNVQAMVFGNLDWESGTGVAFTRNPATGEKELYGEVLLNAQGEDIVAGIRTPDPISTLATKLPDVYAQLQEVANKLEHFYKDVQDVEFTIEHRKLWLLQTRSAKRTGKAAVRIAVDMVDEGILTPKEALLRVEPQHIEQLLHPTIDPSVTATPIATGLPASPGAASGKIVFNADEAEKLAQEGEPIILVRPETSPDDFHGMVAAKAIVTARGGMTSHAAVVARGMGKPCVVGASSLRIEESNNLLLVDSLEIKRGEWITVDGSSGAIYAGKLPTLPPQYDEYFHRFMQWADEVRTMGIRANADTPHDAKMARDFGAEGIGLCRTEHMFFGEDRLPLVREMIMAPDRAARHSALEKLLPLQRQDFYELFKVMDGYPVTIRLLDPPLHEFLPNYEDLLQSQAELKFALQKAASLKAINELLNQLVDQQMLLRQTERLREANPMLGHRGCRLSLTYPEIAEMQSRAIFEAACKAASEGITVIPEIMIPLVAFPKELHILTEIIHNTAKSVFAEQQISVEYSVGTMIELPRACLVADQIAEIAQFFSFGTNDLTQTTLGMSRDDSARFLPNYIELGILPEDPFRVLDTTGVGQLLEIAVEKGRATRENLKIGICGEHGGEPHSIHFCHTLGFDYVSCSPYRIPVARLAAAQATLQTQQSGRA